MQQQTIKLINPGTYPIPMKLFDLGEQSWLDTQLIYHALAYLGIEGLVIQKTQNPYICLGLFNDPRDELDLDFLAREHIPFFRREIGGGTVWLDSNQLFYHLIIHRDNPICPVNNRIFFERFLAPVIKTYRGLGLDAVYVPPNDLIVMGKKISGNGAGLINDFKILSGSILFDFDPLKMARCIRAPDERFREEFHGLLNENITTIKKELGEFNEEKIKEMLINNFQEALGVMESSVIDEIIRFKMQELANEKFTDDWLYSSGKPGKGRQVKVREGLYQFSIQLKSFDFSGTRDNRKIRAMEIKRNGNPLEEKEHSHIRKELEDEIFNILLRTA